MVVTLEKRTAETVRIYFDKAGKEEIRRFLPQKAKTVEEALADYQQTLLPGTRSFGQTIYADGQYVGDIWCYCLQPEDTPGCMLSFCIFETALWSKGIATAAVPLFIRTLRARFGVRSIGAFTFSHNHACLKVLQRSGFSAVEEWEEDGVRSTYLECLC